MKQGKIHFHVVRNQRHPPHFYDGLACINTSLNVKTKRTTRWKNVTCRHCLKSKKQWDTKF